MFACSQRLRASIVVAALATFGCPGSSDDEPTCGDGVAEGAEVCDDGNSVTEIACPYGTPSCTACNAACSASLSLAGLYCGNGDLNAIESCDDGNVSPGDGCSATCEIEAGYDCYEPSGCVVVPVLVRTTSGGHASLDGTVWTSCEADSPAPGQSSRRTDAFAGPDVTHSEDVYTASTDCTGPTDPAAHLVVHAVVIAATDRTVGWNGPPPAGLGAQVIATGLTFADPSTREVILRDVRLLDLGATLLYGGNNDGPADGDGYPTQLEPTPSNPPPPSMSVGSASGATFDLTGTTWTTCEADSPEVGQSYAHAWAFGSGTASITHDVHTAATDCTGTTDAGQHFFVSMSFEVGPDRTVGWQAPAPAGYPASVVASGVTFSLEVLGSVKGVAFVDDQRTPPVIFITNPGDPPPPTDTDGYPTQLPNFGSPKL